MKNTNTNSGLSPGHNATQAYWTVVWDVACGCDRTAMVEATDHEQAKREAVRIANAENDDGPDDDAGIVPIVSFSRAELLAMLEAMPNTGDAMS